MNTLTKWFQNTQKRQRNFSSLIDAITTNEITRYAFYRLRFAGLNVVIQLIVHITEFVLLASIFTITNFIALFLLRTVAVLCRSGWWGTLEILRSRVRLLYADNNLVGVRREISNWMLLASILALIVFIPALTLLYYKFPHHKHLSDLLFRTYLFVILARIALQFIVLTFHSGIYAIKRVARPFYSVSITDILAITIFVILSPVVNILSLPISLLISALVSGALSIFYTKRTYRASHFLPLYIPKMSEFLSFLASLLCAELIFATLAGMLLSIDGIIITLLLLNQAGANRDKLAIALYLIAPVIRAAIEWASIFYFDLKRALDPLLIRYKQAFELKLLWLSVYVAIITWLLSLVVIIIIDTPHFFVDEILMLVFLLLLSSVGYLQMKAFCNNSYFNVIISGILILFTLLFVHLLTHIRLQLFALITCYAILLIYLLFGQLRTTTSIRMPRKALCRYEWLYALSTLKMPTSLYKLSLTNPTETLENKWLANLIARYLSEQGRVYYANNSKEIYCFTTKLFAKEFSPVWLALHSNGIINAFQPIARDLTIFTEKELLNQKSSLATQAVIDLYSKLIKNSILIYPGKTTAELKHIPLEKLREILRCACAFIRNDRHFLKSKSHSIEALLVKSEIICIFMTSLKENTQTALTEWREILRAINLKNSINISKV